MFPPGRVHVPSGFTYAPTLVAGQAFAARTVRAAEQALCSSEPIREPRPPTDGRQAESTWIIVEESRVMPIPVTDLPKYPIESALPPRLWNLGTGEPEPTTRPPPQPRTGRFASATGRPVLELSVRRRALRSLLGSGSSETEPGRRHALVAVTQGRRVRRHLNVRNGTPRADYAHAAGTCALAALSGTTARRLASLECPHRRTLIATTLSALGSGAGAQTCS
jgi:hypothetical protein